MFNKLKKTSSLLFQAKKSFSAVRQFHASRIVASEATFKHQNSEENNENTPFDFTPESYDKVKVIMAKYPSTGRQSGILPLLHLTQEQTGGWVPLNAMKKIADICGVHPRKVFEVATFYTMYNREPVGKYHVLVCVTTPCMISGSDNILEALEAHLGVSLGETTPDKVFTLGEMECMGCCVNAPMIVVADYSAPPKFSYNFYEDLTSAKAIEIVEALKKGEKPTHGPQNGRQNSMPKGGRTCLHGEPAGPFMRPDLDKD